MKIILCIINFGLILSLSSAQYNAFTITRFPQLDKLLDNLIQFGDEPDTSSYNGMRSNARKNLCEKVFKANIYTDKEEEDKIFVLTIQERTSKLINLNPNYETQVVTSLVDYRNFARNKKFLLCYSNFDVNFFIMADNSTTTERYFLFFKAINHDEPIHLHSTVIGFAEQTPNLISLSTTDNGSDEYYYSHLLNTDLAVRSTVSYRFCTLFEDETIRLCSSIFEYVINVNNTTPEIFIVTPQQPGDKNGDCHKIEIKLKTFRGIIYETSPILHCGVSFYPRGLEIPPIIFHVIPHPSNKTTVFLVEPINLNRYKLTKHLENVSALDRENLQFRNEPMHVSRRFWWFP